MRGVILIFAKLLKRSSHRLSVLFRAVFSFGLGYFDGESDTILTADEVGFTTDEPRGDNLHGWTELLYVYGYDTFPGRSLAELDDDEWQEYLASIEEVDVFAKLRDSLVKKS